MTGYENGTFWRRCVMKSTSINLIPLLWSVSSTSPKAPPLGRTEIFNGCCGWTQRLQMKMGHLMHTLQSLDAVDCSQFPEKQSYWWWVFSEKCEMNWMWWSQSYCMPFFPSGETAEHLQMQRWYFLRWWGGSPWETPLNNKYKLYKELFSFVFLHVIQVNLKCLNDYYYTAVNWMDVDWFLFIIYSFNC